MIDVNGEEQRGGGRLCEERESVESTLRPFHSSPPIPSARARAQARRQPPLALARRPGPTRAPRHKAPPAGCIRGRPQRPALMGAATSRGPGPGSSPGPAPAAAGLENFGNTCYANSVLQARE